MKFILLGFPKSGTSSFQYLFEQMGYNSGHWVYKDEYIGVMINHADTKDVKLFTYLKELDCITQMDVCVSQDINFWHQITHLEKIKKQYPNTKFILNVRDKFKVLNSMKNWINNDKSYFDRILEFNNIVEYVGKTKEDKILNWIEDHHENVRSLFKENKNFIEYNIETDSIEKLRDFIKIPNHIVEFPKKNVR